MDSKQNELKSAKSVESPVQPFLLEITPEQLVVPSTGHLEVEIKNPTKDDYIVYAYFDSFFWSMKWEDDLTERREDCSSMCFDSSPLFPGESRTLIIGNLDEEMKELRSEPKADGPCDKCGKNPCPHHMRRVFKVPPYKRIFYNHERPEGFLVVKYILESEEMNVEPMERVDSFPTKRMDLQLKEETEEYKKYREQFEEIRKEQARRARWGHVLVNKRDRTFKMFRDLDGTVREYGDWRKKETEWERDILPDLKQLDGFSDEQILEIRKERKEKIEEKHRKEEEEAKKRAEDREKEEKEQRKKKKEEEERIKKEEERIKKEEEEKKKKKEKEEEEMRKKKEKEEAAAAAKEESKVKTVEKSKRPEEPSQSVQKSTKSNVSVAPPKADAPPINAKSAVKPNATKSKKKKANPCCTVL